MLLLVSQTVLLVLKLFSGSDLPDWSYFVPSISGILLWQLVILSKVKMTGEQET